MATRILTAIVGAIFPFPASAEQKPALALHELVVSAQDSIDRHEIAVLVVVLGLVLFAVAAFSASTQPTGFP